MSRVKYTPHAFFFVVNLCICFSLARLATDNDDMFRRASSPPSAAVRRRSSSTTDKSALDCHVHSSAARQHRAHHTRCISRRRSGNNIVRTPTTLRAASNLLSSTLLVEVLQKTCRLSLTHNNSDHSNDIVMSYIPTDDDNMDENFEDEIIFNGEFHHNKSNSLSHTDAELREAFRIFDKDGDGTITTEELGKFSLEFSIKQQMANFPSSANTGTVMRNLGQFPNQSELERMLSEIDINGDGKFSFDEFAQIMSNMGVGGGQGGQEMSYEDEIRELRDAFKVFDKQNTGYITPSDLRAVLQCMGEDLTEGECKRNCLPFSKTNKICTR